MPEPARRPEDAREDARLVRRFLMAMALATAATWLAGAVPVRFETLASVPLRGASPDADAYPDLGPDSDSDLALVLGGAARETRRLEAALPAPEASTRPSHASVAVSIERVGDAPRRSGRARPALAVLDPLARGDPLPGRVGPALRPGTGATVGTALIAVPPAADALRLRLVTRDGAGPHRFGIGRARLLGHRPLYTGIVAALGLVWAVLAAGLARRCLRRAGTLPSLVGGAAVLFVAIGVSLSETAPWPDGLAPLKRLATGALDRLGVAGSIDAGELFLAGHGLAFTLVGALAWALRRRVGAGGIAAAAFVVLLACASEALQRHLLDRSASLADLGVDLAGAALGIGAATLAATLRGRAVRHRRRPALHVPPR